MGKFKPARSQKRPARPAAGALPCIVLVVFALAIFSLLVYGLLSNNAN